ncbi:Heat shock protein [Heterostelium album PN500]|uniref:Heat shock protein n=1 Tax=Heterostelium pallidum (strain ATCC 26659 / Pp 5 / PN500) TaxID=670386 RepID=D3BG85_HETP5|nr:Heat shock protein [Heterostelium album PN500]EFA79485.1 Heat shock protein [Heterostelium album PN500]|eukprot:XP_020431606.1 Heat shock protein [Heterostelium album PN500]
MSKYINLLKKTDVIIPSLRESSQNGIRSFVNSSSNNSNTINMVGQLSSEVGRMNYYSGGHYGGHPQFYANYPADPMRKKATTILSVRRGNKVVIIGDGQVSQGHSIVKPNAKKIRRLADGKIVAGFAGSVADAFTLFELLEKKLTEHRGLLLKSCVELAQQWRTDKYYRRLEASLIVADKDITLNIDGNGDVLEPNDGVLAIGSGGEFALSAARALLTVPDLDAEEIARRSMKIAADICIYTNHNFILETIEIDPSKSPSTASTQYSQQLDLSQAPPTTKDENNNNNNQK